MQDYYTSRCERCGSEVLVEYGGYLCVRCEDLNEEEAEELLWDNRDLELDF